MTCPSDLIKYPTIFRDSIAPDCLCLSGYYDVLNVKACSSKKILFEKFNKYFLLIINFFLKNVTTNVCYVLKSLLIVFNVLTLENKINRIAHVKMVFMMI